MDNGSPLEENNLDGLCDSISSPGDHNSINKLSTSLADNLKTNDENYVHKIAVEEDDIEEEEDDFSEEALLVEMGYGKPKPKSDLIQKHDSEYSDEEEDEEEEFLEQMGYYAKFNNKPKKPQTQYLDEEEEEEEEQDDRKLLEESILAQMGYLKNEPPKHEPITTPLSELNLISAFKGSREKEGVSAKERRVSWAPDVYDPLILSDYLTVVKSDRPTSDLKVKGLAGKNRQKGGGKKAVASEGEGGGGKGKRGGGSKGGAEKGKTGGKDKNKKYGDKKQAKKRGGSSSKYSDYGED